MPNTLSYLMLMLWPLVCIGLFRRLASERAIVWSLLGGYLLLPEQAQFDFPLVPDFDKETIPSLCAFAFCLLTAGRRVQLWPASPVVGGLMILFLFGVVPTVLTNTDPIIFRSMLNTEPLVFESGRLPGLRWIDVLSVMSTQAIVLMPFVLGRAFL
jgi:hypothetical protein